MTERFPRLAPDHLDAAQRALYDELTGGPRATGPQLFPLTDAHGRLLGPFDAMLRNPPVGEALQALGARLRYQGRLSDHARELVILAVAGHHGNRFERAAHERVGRAAGLAAAHIDAVLGGHRPATGAPVVDAAVDVAHALLRRADLSDPEYTRAAASLPADLLLEVVCLVGYYSTLALVMRAFRSDHPMIT